MAVSCAVPMTEVGRVWGTSARRAPRVSTMRASRSRATPTTWSQKVRQRRWGSVPSTTTASTPATDPALSWVPGHEISRVSPSTRWTDGRVEVKSKNSSGSISPNGSGAQRSRSQRAAVLAASPASFHPSKAATTTGRRSVGRLVQRTCSTRARLPAPLRAPTGPSRRAGPAARGPAGSCRAAVVPIGPGGPAAAAPYPPPPGRGPVFQGLQSTATRSTAGRSAPKPTCAYRTIQTNLCTHGPDAAPVGTSVDAPPPARAAAGIPGIECAGDGVSGLRTLVIYARASDVPDRYDSYVDRIRAWTAAADAVYQDSAAETGGTRRIRFVHDDQCVMRVTPVVLPPTGDDSFDAMVAALRAAGHNRTDRKYLVFTDATVYCGIASLAGDDRPGATNASNGGPSYARVDRPCWGGSTAAHEHQHNMGGVQDSAPHASGGGHCTDEWDVMCYSDEPLHPTMRVVCPDPL